KGKMDHSPNRFGGNGVESILANYKLGKTLGIGSFGKVKIAEHVVTGHKVAIKILNRRKIKNMEMEEKVRREIKILRLFMHHHIIRQYEVIETPSDIYVVMEYVKSGELFDYIVEKGRLQEEEARNFFQQVISGKLYAGPEVDVWSCGVILYALLCGTLPFDDENIPNLFKKIKGGIYTLPSHLSPDARDLIPRMLVVDPVKRITIPEIRQHRWFQTHLPRYLAVAPPDTLEQAKKINEEIVQEVVNMGFDRNQVMESLRNRVQNDATVTYYLLLDNRFRVPSGYLESEFQETTDSGSNPMRSAEAAASPVGHWVPSPMDQYGLGGRSQVPSDRKWALGLQSQAHPREIMNEVLKALQELNVCWKKIGHYNMKCRWVPCFADGLNTRDNNQLHFGDDSSIIEDDCAMTSPTVIKFELQLYKAREEKYLLDIQRVNGPQFLFLDLCAAFLTKLRFTTLASIAFVVVLLSSTAPIKSEFQSLSTKPPCTTIDITECVPAIIFGAQLSPDCCQNLKVQQPCYCGFINNAGLRPYITSPQGHAALASCGIPFPGGIYTLVPDSSSSLSCCCSTRYSRAGQKGYCYILPVTGQPVPSGYLESEFQETTDSGSNPILFLFFFTTKPCTCAAVLFPPPCRSSRRNDPAKLKRRLLKWSDVTTTNTTMPKSSSSSIIEDDCAMILPTVIKFERQLYKAREEKYLLDIQRVNGPQFLFLDLCAAFLTELRRKSQGIMKFTTLASIAFVVVVLFHQRRLRSIPNLFNLIHLAPLLISQDAFQPYSMEHHYRQNPYITSPQGHAALASCGIPYPTC
ncbi:hypothetical protein HID58_093105, partial [Brassica napus]